MTHLNDISKVYMEKVAAKPDFLDLDKDGNKKEPMKKAAKEVEAPKEKLKTDRDMFNIPKGEQQSAKERLLAKARAKRAKMSEEVVDEAVKGQDTEMRKAAASDRKSGEKRLPPSSGKGYADQQKQSISYMDKLTKKNKNVVGLVTKEALDPVGKEDADVDNDGKKNTKADKYLMNRRKAIGNAMKEAVHASKTQIHSPHEVPSGNLKGLVAKAVKRIDTDVDGDTDNNDKAKGELGEFIPGVGNKRLYSTTKTKTAKESFSNWKQEILEVMDDSIDSKPIKEKKVNNKIKINPKLGEAIEQLGGEIIEMVQLDEMPYQVYGSPDGKKERKIGKPVKSKKYADARASELADTHKATGGKYRSQYVEEIEFDDIIESVYTELIEEGFSEDEVEFGIETALTTLDEGYYDSAVAASKAAAAKTKGETPKVSMKDRLKSAAKKAIIGGARAAGKAVRAGAAAAAAPGRAKRKVSSIADKVKKVAKAGYESGRGPVEKKSKTAYRGAGVGRKEKIGEENVVSEASYEDISRKVDAERKAEAEKKDTRLRVTYADKKGNTPAYQKFKSGDKRYRYVGEENELQEKALSKKQQRFMGMVYAAKKGEEPASPEVAKAAASMTAKQAKDFAGTKHKGLPEKKEVKEGSMEAPMSPQELALQKRKTMIDQMITKKRQQTLQKQKTTEEFELDERTRYAKETGKDPQTGKPSVKGGNEPPAAMKYMQKDLRKSGGMMSSRKKPIQPQGKKKEKGKKGYQGVTPVDRIKGQLARKRAPKPDIGSRFD